MNFIEKERQANKNISKLFGKKKRKTKLEKEFDTINDADKYRKKQEEIIKQIKQIHNKE